MNITISAQTFTSILIALVVFGAIQGAVAYCILLERKIAAWTQDRIGPNRVGPMGLFQPLADGLKLFLKEDYTPRTVDFWLFILAPAFIVIPAFIGWAIVPWGGVWNCLGFTLGPLTVQPGTAFVGVAPVNVGIVFVLAVAGLAIYGVVLGGWASNNKYAFFGGLRATAQMISYEIPLGIAILIVLLMAGSLRPDNIIESQVTTSWFIIAQPIAALIYFISILAESNRAPFDLAEAEQELVGGYHTEYASMKWALFFFAEYAHMITNAAIFTVLFLGGWHIFPFIPQGAEGGLLAVIFKMLIFGGKVSAIIVLMMVVRWTLPRFRYDQLMNLAWRQLIPLSAILLLATAFLIYLGRDQWYWLLTMNIITIIIIFVLQPFLPKISSPNSRAKLTGSRFSPPPQPTNT